MMASMPRLALTLALFSGPCVIAATGDSPSMHMQKVSPSHVLSRSRHVPLLAKAGGGSEPLPSAKLLDVAGSSAAETAVILLFLRGASELIYRLNPRYEFASTWIAWLAVIQTCPRLQGIMQRSTEVISPEWYKSLKKPDWTPPGWAFPAIWIPLKLLQVQAAARVWSSSQLRAFTSPAIVLFVLHLTLGDTWNAQFFLKQRKLTGLLVIYTFWISVIASTVMFWRVDPVAGALLAPTIVWVAIASSLNLDIWFLNR